MHFTTFVTLVALWTTSNVESMTYLAPLKMGRTFNKHSSTVGVDIFSSDMLQANLDITQAPFLDTKFEIIQSSQAKSKFLDIDGKLSLDIISGKIQARGSGKYLNDNSDRRKTVEVLVKATYETRTETLRTASSLQPRLGWDNYDPDVLGTHFVNSITYGGQLIASLKYISEDKETADEIKGALSAALNLKGFTLEAKGELEMIQRNAASSTRLEISYFANTKVAVAPQSIQTLLEAVSRFSESIQAAEEAGMPPVRVELTPLTTLQSGSHLPQYIAKTATMAYLDSFRTQYEDLLLARREFNVWTRRQKSLVDSDEDKLSRFNDLIEQKTRIFYKTAQNLDETIDVSQFDASKQAYEADGIDHSQRYYSMFTTIQKEVLKNLIAGCFDLKSGIGIPVWNMVTSNSKSHRSYTSETLLDCKVTCVLSKRCYSISWITVPEDLQQPNRCFINTLAPDEFLAVPSYPTDVYYYQFNRDACPAAV